MKLFILLLIFSGAVHSHPGRTNSNGCHNDNVGGTGFHCHNSKPPTIPFTPPPSPPPIATPVPPPTPAPDPMPVNLPETNQDGSVLRASINQIPSIYTDNTADLQCIYTSKGFFNVDLKLTDNSFCIDTLEQVEQCSGYSGKYSFLTNILSIFNIDVGLANFRASLEMNNAGCFDIYYSLNNEDGSHIAPDYNRDAWGDWIDQDGDCQDTRDEVLSTFNQTPNDSCDVTTGVWLDPYTATEFVNSSALDIDHIVPLSYAHEHAAANWSSELKEKFYNDQENLLPVSASANRSKGSKSPVDWMPDNTDYHCIYVDSFLYIVDKYHLDISDAERENIKDKCVS